MHQVHLQECVCEGSWGPNAHGLIEVYYSGSRSCDFLEEYSFHARDHSLDGWDTQEISEALIGPLCPGCLTYINTHWAVSGGSADMEDDVAHDLFSGSIEVALKAKRERTR